MGLHSLSALGGHLVLPILLHEHKLYPWIHPLSILSPIPRTNRVFCSVSFDSDDTEAIGMQTSFCHAFKMLVYLEEDRRLLWLDPVEEEMLWWRKLGSLMGREGQTSFPIRVSAGPHPSECYISL